MQRKSQQLPSEKKFVNPFVIIYIIYLPNSLLQHIVFHLYEVKDVHRKQIN